MSRRRKGKSTALCSEILYCHDASSLRTLPQITSCLQIRHDAAPFGQYLGTQPRSHARQRKCSRGFHLPHCCQPFFRRNVCARQQEDSDGHSLPLQECCEMCRIVSVESACKGARRCVARPPSPLGDFLNRLLGAHSALCILENAPGYKDDEKAEIYLTWSTLPSPPWGQRSP